MFPFVSIQLAMNDQYNLSPTTYAALHRKTATVAALLSVSNGIPTRYTYGLHLCVPDKRTCRLWLVIELLDNVIRVFRLLKSA